MTQEPRYLDVVIIGAGFAGVYMLYRVRELGMSVRVLEAEAGVGGTWYRNRYPGARSDVESFDYSYSFLPELDQEWVWAERYPSQPQILAYINHVVDRLQLGDDIQLHTRVIGVHWDEERGLWSVTTEAGEVFACRFCITAVGGLSTPKVPDIPGVEHFQGPVVRSTEWPEEGIDLSGLRVGLIGTGSTGIQLVPELARQAGRLTVFQRTPNFSLPNGNRALTEAEQATVKAAYPERRKLNRVSSLGLPIPLGPQSVHDVDPATWRGEFDRRWAAGGGAFLLAYSDLLVDPAANDIAADYFRERIREKVDDPETARKLSPTGYPVGAKRLCLDSGYFETFNRDNVSLVDLRAEPIERVSPAGIVTTAGEYEFDVLVLAIGFDAVTGSLLALDIRGREGVALAERWVDGPRAYLGLQTAGFPNLFMLTGPGSPSIVVNVVVAIEQHVEWLTDCLRHMREKGIESIEATEEAQAAWVEHVRVVAESTLFPRADSFYLGANVPGKPRVFMPYLGGVDNYRAVCDRVVDNGYDGFVLRERSPASTPIAT